MCSGSIDRQIWRGSGWEASIDVLIGRESRLSIVGVDGVRSERSRLREVVRGWREGRSRGEGRMRLVVRRRRRRELLKMTQIRVH